MIRKWVESWIRPPRFSVFLGYTGTNELSSKNAAGEKKSSVAGKPRSGKWVESKLLENANNWKIDRKSS
jgi:hypothetical protein